MTQTLFVTGNSSGLGFGLTHHYLDHSWRVYGMSRRGFDCNDKYCPCEARSDLVQDCQYDLSDFEHFSETMNGFLKTVPRFDLVILNAGILGEIKELSATSLADLQKIMDINVWANKAILDWFKADRREVGQIVLISSGASVNGNKGWGGYSISKAALNMLAKLYAHEFEHTHISALAPGLIDSPMQDYLCDQADAVRFPSLQRLRDSRGTDQMPDPMAAGQRVAEAIPLLRKYPSGSYLDIREL